MDNRENIVRIRNNIWTIITAKVQIKSKNSYPQKNHCTSCNNHSSGTACG